MEGNVVLLVNQLYFTVNIWKIGMLKHQCNVLAQGLQQSGFKIVWSAYSGHSFGFLVHNITNVPWSYKHLLAWCLAIAVSMDVW